MKIENIRIKYTKGEKSVELKIDDNNISQNNLVNQISMKLEQAKDLIETK